jgi:hypothetical protein
MTIDSPIITGSVQSPINLTGNISASGAITGSGFFTSGNIVANTLVVQVVSSSVDYITGSAKFGTLSSNTFQFTGSLFVTGGLYVTGSNIGVNTTSATSPLSLYFQSTGSDVNYIKMEMPSWGGSTNFKKNIIWHDGGQIVGGIGMAYTFPYTYMDFHSFYNSAATTGSLMRIQGNGNVGIGTTSPSYLLSFGGDSAVTIGMNQSTLGTAPALTIKGADSPTGTNNEGGPVYVSSGLGTGNGATSNIIFSTSPATGSGTIRQTLTERMRITSAGLVGIGANSPKAPLQVSSATTGTATLPTLGQIGSYTSLYVSNLNYAYGLLMGSINNGNSWIQAQRTDGTATAYDLQLQPNGGNTITGGTLILGTSGFVGNIQFGTSGYGTLGYDAGNGKMTFLSTAGAVAGTIYYSFNADGAGARFTIANNGAATLVGSLTQNTSDKRLKDNVKNIDNALNKVMALNGVTFDWNDIAVEYGWSPRIKNNDIGVIAQEVQAVLPQAIDFAPFDRDENHQSKSGENYLTVQYEKIVPLLIEAIKELKAEIDELKNK